MRPQQCGACCPLTLPSRAVASSLPSCSTLAVPDAAVSRHDQRDRERWLQHQDGGGRDPRVRGARWPWRERRVRALAFARAPAPRAWTPTPRSLRGRDLTAGACAGCGKKTQTCARRTADSRRAAAILSQRTVSAQGRGRGSREGCRRDDNARVIPPCYHRAPQRSGPPLARLRGHASVQSLTKNTDKNRYPT